ncbi:MAG: isochorismatase family protein [Planctomycetota bacterium]
MISPRRSDVFVDMCTQRDYLDPAGGRPALNAHLLVPNVKHLMAFARWAKVAAISCVDARRPDDVRGLPEQICVLGTPGQQKLACTLLPNHVRIDSDNCLCVALDLLHRHQQAILGKEHRDPFTNPKLDRLLTEMPARRFVVFGVALEASVRLLVLGLLLRRRSVALIHDACGWWNAEDGGMALRQLAAKGCEILSTQQWLEAAAAQYRRTARIRLFRRRSVA